MQKKELILFDLNGTLVDNQRISQEIVDQLQNLSKAYDLGLVGGSSINIIKNTLNEETLKIIKYIFSENGLVGFKHGNQFHNQNLIKELGNEYLNSFINFCLKKIAEIDIEIKRGCFIDFRTGMINISPIGRNCNKEERLWFDNENKSRQILQSLQSELEQHFGNKLKFSIGGQIGIDCFPHGWDKSYCLQFVSNEYEAIYFFGDKTEKGGNDYEIYNDPRITKGFSVRNYQHTLEILKEQFNK